MLESSWKEGGASAPRQRLTTFVLGQVLLSSSAAVQATGPIGTPGPVPSEAEDGRRGHVACGSGLLIVSKGKPELENLTCQNFQISC